MWKVQLFKLNYDEREANAVKEVVESGWITMGEKTRTFEERFGEMVGRGASCTAVSSATAALHISLMALGIGPGDEVVIPALTFVADINVVRIVGARPVLADCAGYGDWNVSAETIERVLTPKTKAVIIVHFAGYPCDMDAITALCEERGIALIEDCAHAPGAYYKGRHVGTFGAYGCFSFFTNKNLSVGEGGMITTTSKENDQQARYFRSHGMTALTLDRHKGRAITYDVVQPGLNYRIDEMRSALGLVQLEKLPQANAQRKALVERYHAQLKELEGVTIPFLDPKESNPSYHIYPILLDSGIDRIKVIEALKSDGIQSSIHYPAFKEFTAFKAYGLNPAPIAEEIAKRELTLPLYPTMEPKMVDLVVHSLKKALKA